MSERAAEGQQMLGYFFPVSASSVAPQRKLEVMRLDVEEGRGFLRFAISSTKGEHLA